MVRVEGRACRKAVSRGARGLRTNTHTLTRPFLLARCRREVSVCCFLACASRGPEFGMIPYTACVGIRSGKKKTFRAEAQRWQVVHPPNAELVITQVSARANSLFIFPIRFCFFFEHVFFAAPTRRQKVCFGETVAPRVNVLSLDMSSSVDFWLSCRPPPPLDASPSVL
jgi:hypothetical protein